MAIDSAGNAASVRSNGFVVDLTGPVVGAYVSNVPPAAQSWRNLSLALWNVVDAESAIAEVQACLRVAASGARPSVPLLPCTPISSTMALALQPMMDVYVDAATAAAADALLSTELAARLSAANGSAAAAAPLYVTIDFIVSNRAHLATRFTAGATLIDPQPAQLEFLLPVEGSSWRALGFNGSVAPALTLLQPLPAATSNTSAVGFAWMITAPKSGVASLSASLGTECGLSDMAPPRALAASRSAVAFTSLDLRGHTAYYMSLNVTSGAGVLSTHCSGALLVDLVVPATSAVVDGAPAAAVLGDGAAATLYVTGGVVQASWAPFVDYGSGMQSYSVRVCAADGFTCLDDWVVVGMVTNVSLAHLPVIDGVTYRVHVRGFDVAGNAADALSPGQVHDSSPPVPPARLQLAAATISSWAELGVTFDDFVDGESGIDHYEVEISIHNGTSQEIRLLPPTASARAPPTRSRAMCLQRRFAAGHVALRTQGCALRPSP